MDKPSRPQDTLRRRRQIITGLLLGNASIGVLLLALALLSLHPPADALLPWRLQVALLVSVIMTLVVAASWLYYGVWQREALGAHSLLMQGLSYRTLLRTASDGIHVLDRERRIVELSDSFAAMLGHPREDLIGKPATHWDARFSEDDMARWFASFSPGQMRKFDSCHRRADDSLIDVEVSCSDVRIDGRDLIYCSARDTTDLLRARRELHTALHEQALMLDNQLVGILKTRGLLGTWANPAMASIFGYRQDDFLGQPLRMLYPDEAAYRAFVDEAIPVLRDGRHYRRQVLTLRKNGTQVWVDVYGVLLSPESQDVLWLLADITPIQESLKRAEFIAFHDALTGLPNRLLLADRLKQSLALAERDKCVLSVCFLDLDGFKHVNDELGHAAGDELLQEVARRLEHCVRANDTVSRVGGDEFVLLLSPQDASAEPAIVLERVRSELAKPIQLLDGSHAAQVTVSIGLAAFPRDGTTPETLLERADRAMYKAKRDGRNRVCVYDGGKS